MSKKEQKAMGIILDDEEIRNLGHTIFTNPKLPNFSMGLSLLKLEAEGRIGLAQIDVIKK